MLDSKGGLSFGLVIENGVITHHNFGRWAAKHLAFFTHLEAKLVWSHVKTELT